MNRFRNKKKGKDGSGEPEQSSMPSLKGFLRGRKAQEEEPKETVDISAALPSHDEFRTSLLMTGLSARFSMLREQDDPSTKIGKASDDSVLYPKRSSRLGDYGFAGLNDIAEVESLRTPFGRIDSDDASSTKGSIMSRGKPTEGNNLFGGRQKISVGNRTLYENDVSTSAFQKWRREEREKERNSARDDDSEDNQDSPAETRHRPSEETSSAARSESPGFAGYNRKRETSSTTSSSLARNSTAATSVVSQPAASIKDSQSQPVATSSTGAAPAVERSVTRTRRLYEQALNQDLHDHQSTALSRIDTLTGKRTFASRSPDLSGNNSASPSGFAPLGERRAMLTKASAPNLRSVSPPTTAPPSMKDKDSVVSSPVDTRSNFIGTPPLSPPVSEAGELPLMAIQPSDRGKATALGVFQKPAQPYDESRYAQRQLQLQQGRETPTQRSRTESAATSRSRSSSSHERQQFAPRLELSIHTDSKQQGYPPQTFLDDSDSELTPESRPNDVHPAFRQGALPTPQSFTSKTSTEPSPLFEKPDISSLASRHESPEDSPMLSPPSGLGGMVRQHMRSESSTSSIYAAPQLDGPESRYTADTRDSSVLGMISGLRASNLQDLEWNPYDDEQGNSRTKETLGSIDEKADGSGRQNTPLYGSNDKQEKEEDNDFANQLANARRRVQERLTHSYAESESSRPTSPMPAAETPKEPAAKPNPLGLLRGKSSRGSLIDRNREGSQPKPLKTLGLGHSTMSTSPSPAKTTFDDAALPPMKEEDTGRQTRSARAPDSTDSGAGRNDDQDANSTKSQEKEEENVHPGLRAFRNARRELQKRKELETLARHHSNAKSTGGSSVEDNRAPEREVTRRAPSRERQPPPRSYQPRRDHSEESHRSIASRSPSRGGERDRSGSEASNGRAGSRPPPPRLRTNSSAYDNQGQGSSGANNGMLRQPMMRSPGLPGTDIRRSPIMPPQPYPGSSPNRFQRSSSSGNLKVHPDRPSLDSMPPQASPISPSVNGLPPSPRMAGPRHTASPMAPSSSIPRRPSNPTAPSLGGSSNMNGTTTASTLNESMKKVVKKEDISDPTFVMSTSRVPTVSLPDNGNSGQRSRSNSRSRSGSNAAEYNAPPVPPINPRRTTRLTAFLGRKNSDPEESPFASSTQKFTSSTPALPVPPSRNYDDSKSTFSVSDDEEEKPASRWRLRKQNSEAQGLNKNAGGSGLVNPFGPSRDTRSFAAAGPPASRSVVTPATKPSASSRNVYGGGMI